MFIKLRQKKIGHVILDDISSFRVRSNEDLIFAQTLIKKFRIYKMFNHEFLGAKQDITKIKYYSCFNKKTARRIDWILPVLDKLKENFNIIAIFEKQIALNLLKQNKILYNLFQKIVFSYIQNSITKSIFYRVAKKISILFKLKSLSNFFQNKIYENYYDIYDLNNEIKKKILILILQN